MVPDGLWILLALVLCGVLLYAVSRFAYRFFRLYWYYRPLTVTPSTDLIDREYGKVAVEGTVEPVDGNDDAVYLQVERQRASNRSGRRWRLDTARIAAREFDVADAWGSVRVDPTWLQERHDLTVGDAATAPAPRTSPYVQFSDATIVDLDHEEAAVIHETFPDIALDPDESRLTRYRYRVSRVGPGDDVLVGGSPVIEQGRPVFRGGDAPLVLSDRSLDAVRGRFLKDGLWALMGCVTVGVIFLVVLLVGIWEFLQTESGHRVLRWLLS